MHTTSLFLATVAVLSTVISAEELRPRFYFPRQIKRQIFNSTITSPPAIQTTQDSSSSAERSVSDGSDSTSGDGVTTVVVQETTVIPTPSPASESQPAENGGIESLLSGLLDPSLASTGGIIPPIVVPPTVAPSVETPSPDSTPSSESVGGIVFGPDGISTNGGSSATPTSNPDPESQSAVPSTSPPSQPTAPTSAPAAATTSLAASAAASSAASGGDLLSSLLDPLTSLLPPIPVPSTTDGITGAASTGVIPPTTVLPAAPSSTIDTESTGLGSILSSILNSPTTSEVGSVPTSVVSESSVGPTGVDTISSAPTLVPVSPISSVPVNTNTSAIETGLGPTDSGSVPTSTVGSAPTTIPGISITSTATGISASAATNGTDATATDGPTSGPVTSVDATPTTTAPVSVFPTGTNSETSQWLPATIIAQSSSTAGVSETGSAPTGISSLLPKVIISPNASSQPDDTTMIQIGFLFPLNYEFVVNNPMSSAQIFNWLPSGLADGLSLELSQVTIHSLIPLDTTQQLNYITTIANAFIPSSMTNTLSLNIHIPTSPLYNNPNPSINTLMNYINPAIPIIPGSTLNNGATGTGSGSAATPSTDGGNNGDIYSTQSQSTSSGVSGTTAGIALAAIGGSAAYGAAMFLIARRYKRRKQSHRRSSSVMNPSEMRQSGSPALLGGAAAFMSGGRTSPGNDRNSRGSGRTGNSARTQQISAPMMAENSLGWN